MLSVGPYRFSEQDARRLLGEGRLQFELLLAGVGADGLDAAASYRADAEAVLADLEAGRLDEAEALALWWGSWRGAMQALRHAGVYGPSAQGVAVACFVSDGGVPKHPTPQLEIGFGGVVGDRQADRRHHGAPTQAVCLWSQQVIDAFRDEGHPLRPGLAGENLTVSGLAWPKVRPGVHLRAGSARLEITDPAVPCSKNAAWFRDGRFDVMHHRNGPVSRMYATVVEPGRVTMGDAVILEPDA